MVFTVTLKGVTTVASKVWLAGTEQVACAGAPVQVSVADPLIPPPPSESVYAAVCPATTVAEFVSPGNTPSARVAVNV